MARTRDQQGTAHEEYMRIFNQMGILNTELSLALARNNVAIEAYFTRPDIVVDQVLNDKKSKAELQAAFTGAGIGAPDAELLAKRLFGVYQYKRIEKQNEDDLVIADVLENEDNVDVLVEHFSTLASPQAVDAIFGDNLSYNGLFDSIYGDDENPGIENDEGDGLECDIDDFVDAYYGKVQYQRILKQARDQGNIALVGELTSSPQAVAAIKAKIGSNDEATDNDDIDRLITAIHTADKPDLDAAFAGIGVVVQNRSAVFGENEYRRIMADNALLANPSELRTVLSDPARKQQLQDALGMNPDKNANNNLINASKDPSLDKDRIVTNLMLLGFDQAIAEAAAKKIYRETQYQRFEVGGLWDAHVHLKNLIHASEAAFKTQLENNASLATVQAIKALGEKISVKDVKTALTAAGIAATDAQVQEIAEENRVAALGGIPAADQPLPAAFIAAHTDAKFHPNMGSLERESVRLEAMKAFVKTALNSRTAANDAAALERIDDSVHKLTEYVKKCERLCAHDAALPGADAAACAAKTAKLQEMMNTLVKIRNGLTQVKGLAQNTPENIAVIGSPGAAAKVHPELPNSSSYKQAWDELGQFFNGPVVGGGAHLAAHAKNQPTPRWDAGVSRSVTSKIDFDYKQAVTRREVTAAVKTGLIQTETKQNPAGPSSYRQDFFFEATGAAKMRKGDRQFTPPNKTPDIPADHVMRWANDAVRNFMAFADTKGKVITINAGDMPKRCLEALAIMSKVHDLKFEIRGARLGITYDELNEKVALTKAMYGTQLQTALEVTSSNIVPPRPGRL